MDKLQEYLSTKNNWESQLYKMIGKALSKLASKYQIKEDVIDKELKLIFYKAYNSVGGNKEEFVIRKKVKGNFSATEEILNAVVMNANDDYLDLNNKAIDMVVDNFISPLIEKYELIKKNKRTEVEKSLVHQALEVTQIKLGETGIKLAQMERIAERKAKKGWNNESIKYTDIVKAIKEIMDIDPSFNIKKKAVKRIGNQAYVLTESDIVNRICEHKKCTWNKNQIYVVKKHIQKARKNEAICPGEKQCIIF